MRKATRRLSDDLASVTTKYLKERALNCSLEVDMKLTKSANKDLKQQLAALEAKGSVYIQAHEAALGCVDGKIRDGEKQLQAWIKTEIPRLLTGLPISEDDYGEYDVEDALNALGVNFRQHENFPGSRWTEEKGGRPGAFDHFSSPSREQSQQRYFALAQALCTSKATQNKVMLPLALLITHIVLFCVCIVLRTLILFILLCFTCSWKSRYTLYRRKILFCVSVSLNLQV